MRAVLLPLMILMALTVLVSFDQPLASQRTVVGELFTNTG
jgi:hypothetical protein